MSTVSADYDKSLLTISLTGHVTEENLKKTLSQIPALRKGFMRKHTTLITLANITADRFYLEHIDLAIFAGKVETLSKAIIFPKDHHADKTTLEIAERLQSAYSDCHIPCSIVHSKLELYKKLDILWKG